MASSIPLNLLFFSSLLLIVIESKTFDGDILVLKQLKQSVNPKSINPGSCLSSWDFNVDPCDNIFGEKFTCGFRCDFVDSVGFSRVTELSLDQAGYSGSLASVSWNLPFLESLDFSNNYFTGRIPSSFYKLNRLRRLGLSRNMFSGEIPSSIGSLSVLEELFLDNNNLRMKIPASFKGLTGLKRLELQQNKLYGDFPDLGFLKNLLFLDVSDNQITGGVPANFPISLIQILMRNNNLQGTIPPNIIYLESLQVMDLSNNQLSGSVPMFLFYHQSLQQLSLSNNQFSSIQTPINLGMSSELIAIDFSDNSLQGFLPVFMALMPKLSALTLQNNMFTGMIPTQYALKTIMPGTGSISPFSRLLLGGNYLFGPLPGPLLKLQPGSAMVSLADNCLFRCPTSFFFCQGGVQKSLMVCKSFDPVIP